MNLPKTLSGHYLYLQGCIQKGMWFFSPGGWTLVETSSYTATQLIQLLPKWQGSGTSSIWRSSGVEEWDIATIAREAVLSSLLARWEYRWLRNIYAYERMLEVGKTHSVLSPPSASNNWSSTLRKPLRRPGNLQWKGYPLQGSWSHWDG